MYGIINKYNKNIDNREIKKIFVKNFQDIENRGELKLQTIYSHGDFVNRALQIVNNEIIKDKDLRKQLDLDIECETYDKDIMNSFDIYISDKPYPKFYTPKSIFEYIGKTRVICMLSHPRQWRTNAFVNTFDNLKRIYEGLKW